MYYLKSINGPEQSSAKITKADLGKVYIDMDGKQRTIDRRVVGEMLVAYIVTNEWGKSEITKG